MQDPPQDLDLSRLRELVAEKCNGAISPAGLKELKSLLQHSPSARSEYWKLTLFHANLQWELAGQDRCEELVAELVLAGSENSIPVRGSTRLLTSLALAATLLLCGLIGNLLYQRSIQQQQVTSIENSSLPSSGSELLGRITAVSSESSWTSGQKGKRNPSSVRSGDTVCLDHGAVELRFTNQTVSQLEAPVVLQLLSVDRVRVLRGRIKVDVPEGCEGFTVETAAAEVVDLGTSFSVEVADEETNLVVFEGEVDLKVAEHEYDSGQPVPVAPKRFIAGEAVRVARNGTLSRILNVLPSAYSSGRLHPTRPPVISQVKDNISRDGLWNYYEIVWSGMDEDTLAFVDRSHEWNGLSREGLPRYLLGGDYVKTFNNDKVANDLVIDVTLDCPATLFILLDQRVVPPDWLAENFTLTGDMAGVDEGWDNDPAELAQVGAGNGLDQTHSIWKLEVKEGGVVRLGENGTLPAEKILGTLSEANMYGIVAVPL